MSDSSEETELPQAEKPDNFEERVVSGNERTTRQDIVRLKALLKKALEKKPASRLAKQYIDDLKAQVDKLSTAVGLSINNVQHEESKNWHQDAWLTEEFEFQDWIDIKSHAYEIIEHELAKASPPIQAIDTQINKSATTITQKSIKLMAEAEAQPPPSSQKANSILQQLEQVKKEVDGYLLDLYKDKAKRLHLLATEIMAEYTNYRETIEKNIGDTQVICFDIVSIVNQTQDNSVADNHQKNTAAEDENTAVGGENVVADDENPVVVDPGLNRASTALSNNQPPPVINVSNIRNAGVAQGLQPPRPGHNSLPPTRPTTPTPTTQQTTPTSQSQAAPSGQQQQQIPLLFDPQALQRQLIQQFYEIIKATSLLFVVKVKLDPQLKAMNTAKTGAVSPTNPEFTKGGNYRSLMVTFFASQDGLRSGRTLLSNTLRRS